MTNDDQDLALGRLIQDLRSRAGLSQRELALRLGTTQPGVSRLESGAVTIRLDTLARVAAALGRHLVVAFPEDPPPPSDDAVILR
jgi:transcriptional regulator with XRE-family HTH domain